MAIGPILPLYSKVEMHGFRGTSGPSIKPPSEEKRFKGFDSVLHPPNPDVQDQKHVFDISGEEKEDYDITHIPSKDNLTRKKANAKRIMKLANDEEFQAQQDIEAKQRMEADVEAEK